MTNLSLVNRAVLAFLSLNVLTLDTSALAQGMDLGSTGKSMQVTDAIINSPVTVKVGGVLKTINVGDYITPAEFAALHQVLNSGAQSLGLDGAGRAVSGSFATHQLPQDAISSLAIPGGVTAIHDFARTAGTLNLLGNLSNNGTFFGVSTNPATHTANISAANIFNSANALLTTMLPAGGLTGYPNAISNLNLNLTALTNIINAGTISSAGSLSASAGVSIVNALPTGASSSTPLLQACQNIVLNTQQLTNAGFIESTMGNINIANSSASNLQVNASSGTIKALAGSINIQNPIADNLRIDVHGGDWLSQTLNISNSAGSLLLNVGEVSGTLNLKAQNAHLYADSTSLYLGNVCLTGDPIIASTGNITLTSGTVEITTNGNPLAIIAGGDILTGDDPLNPGNAVVIDTGGATTGGTILMAAGADFTVQGDGSVLINGGTKQGGQIDLSTGPGLAIMNTSPSGSDGDGGFVQLVAFGGDGVNSGIFSGTVLLPLLSSVTTGGKGSGNNGNFWVIAGEKSAQSAAIILGSVDTTGGAGPEGSIRLYTAAPVMLSNGLLSSTLLVDNNGGLPTGNYFYPEYVPTGLGGLILQDNSIVATALKATGGYLPIHVDAGDDITIGAVTYESNGQAFQDLAPLDKFNLLSSPQVNIEGHGNITIIGDLTTDAPTAEVTSTGGLISIHNVFADDVSISAITGLTVNNVTADEALLAAGTDLNVTGLVNARQTTFSNSVNVGSALSPVKIAADKSVSLFVQNAWLQGQGNITVLGSKIQNYLEVQTTNNGDIVLKGNDPQIYFVSFFGKAMASFNEQGSSATTKLVANGSGNIRQDGIIAMFGSELILESGSGNIGLGNLWTNAILGVTDVELGMWVATPKVQARTTGNVELIQRPDGEMGVLGELDYIPLANIEVLNSSIGSGKTFHFVSQSNKSTITLNNLTAGNGSTVDIQSYKDIALIGASGTAVSVGANSTIQLDAAENILVGARSVTSSPGTISATAGHDIEYSAFSGIAFESPTVKLAATDGNIGLDASGRIKVKTDLLSISESNNAYISSETGQTLNLGAVNGGVVDILADNGITTTNVISATDLTMTVSNGDITIDSSTTGSSSLSLNAKNGAVTINDKASVGTLGGQATIFTNDLTNNGQISSNNTSVYSVSGSDLTISGDGTTFGTTTMAAIGNVVDANGIVFADNTHQDFLGPLNLISNGDNQQAVSIGSGSIISGQDEVTIFGKGFQGAGTLNGNPIRIISPNGVGTISNKSGDVNLTSNIVLAGHHLSILASGNITASAAVTSINLSNSKGQGGNVTLVAGYNFTESGQSNASPTPTYGVLHTLSSPSATGGSIALSGVAIDTSSSTTTSERAIAGDVVAVAHAGSTNPGIIMLKSVTAKGSSINGSGGDVLLIGQGGVKVGAITTSGAEGGNVRVLGAESKIVGGSMVFQDGYNRSAARFDAYPERAGAGAAVNVGAISTNGLNGSAGNIEIYTDGRADVTGNINASAKSASKSNVSAGHVSILSIDDQVTTKSIDVSGNDIAATSSMNGGDAGSIVLASPSLVQVNGTLIANGGDALGVSKASPGSEAKGGAGGAIFLNSTRSVNVSGNDFATAQIYVNGTIEAKGGNTAAISGGKTGDGGSAYLNGATVIVSAKLSNGASVDTSPGTAGTDKTRSGSLGQITIHSYAVQPLPTSFNLVSAEKNNYVLPGGLFIIQGSASSGSLSLPAGEALVNGTAGYLKNGSITEGKIRYTSSVAPSTEISVNVHGSNVPITIATGTPGFTANIQTNSVRNKVPAAAAVALYQVTHEQTQSIGIKLDGSIATDFNAVDNSFSVDARDMRSSFTKFDLRSPSTFFGKSEFFGTKVQMNVLGPRPTVDLSGVASSNISGTLNFADNGARALINVGTKSLPLTAYGTIKTNAAAQLIITGSGAAWTNLGTIQTDALVLLGTGSALTYTSQTFGGLIPAALANTKMVLPANGKLPTINFVNLSTNSAGTGARNRPLYFEELPLGLSFGKAAENALPLAANKRTVALTFKYGQSVGSDPSIVGRIHGETVSIKGLANSSVVGAVPTPVYFFAADVKSKTTLLIDSVGPVGLISSKFSAGDVDSTVAQASAKATLTSQKNVSITNSQFRGAGDSAISALNGYVDIDTNTTVGSSQGSFRVLATQQLGIENSFASASKGLSLESKSSIVQVYGSTGGLSTATGALVIKGPMGVTLDNTISAGTLAAGAPSTGVLTKAHVLGRQGTIEVTAGNSTATSPVAAVTLSSGAQLSATGNITIKSFTKDVQMDNPVSITSNGGNVQILAKTTIHDNNSAVSNPGFTTITARAYGSSKTDSIGGGVEFVTGASSSSNLIPALGTKGTVSTNQLGGSSSEILINDNGGTGSLKLITSNTAQALTAIDLVDEVQNQSMLNLNGGAIVFTVKNTVPLAPTVFFDGLRVNVSAYKPIAYSTEARVTAALLQPDDDMELDGSFGKIRIKKGALVAIESNDNSVRIKACSGPTHVHVEIAGRKLQISPGQELLITNAKPSSEQITPADGIGRRQVSSHQLSEKAHITVSDFSIISFVQNTSYLGSIKNSKSAEKQKLINSLLKTAAAIHTVTGGKRGAYTAKPRTAQAPVYVGAML